MNKIKKAILTGGGHATRLRPITTTINKHLIPLAGKPMIFNAIEKVVKAGVEEIYINTNPNETELQKVVGDGSKWGVKIEFFEQTGGPQGIAHVVKLAEKFIGDDPFMFYLSDNIILSDLDELVDEFFENNYDCMLAFSQVKDPERFGVPVFDKNNELIEILEKPNKPPNNLAVTGIYFYGPNLFFEAFNKIKKSSRNEYEISDVHSYLLKNNYKVGYKEITGWWKDTGKPSDLLLANALLVDQLNSDEKNKIGQGTTIDKITKINEPVMIGDNCKLTNCVIGPHVTIGDNCEIKNAQLTNSMIFSNCSIDCATTLDKSIIGKNAKIIKKDKDNDVHNLVVGDNSIIQL